MNSLKKLSIVFICAILFSARVSAGIVEIANLEPFEKALGGADEQSLVLFDVDDTLIMPSDLILRCHLKGSWNKLVTELLQDSSIVQPHKFINDHYTGRILAQMDFIPVDANMLPLISDLQMRNIKAIAFTKIFTGAYGEIPSMEDWRIRQLYSLGFDFTLAFRQFPEVYFTVKGGGEMSLFKQGVLCANKHHKGPVLEAFLDRIKWMPAKVFFIDNRLDYLTSVEEALKNTAIEFFGFHYVAVEKASCVIDEGVAKLQISQLIKTGEWLSDQEAQRRIQATMDNIKK